MEDKTLDITDINGARHAIPDIEVFGNGDLFQLLCKASSKSQGWMKSAKAMQVGNIGCVVQVTTQQKGYDGTYAVAEALTFVPGARIFGDAENGRWLGQPEEE